MVSHFQKLFDVNSLSGVYPRMNEVYTRLEEMTNMTRNLRDVLELGDLQLELHFGLLHSKKGKCKIKCICGFRQQSVSS